jgi:hypothetical protein
MTASSRTLVSSHQEAHQAASPHLISAKNPLVGGVRWWPNPFRTPGNTVLGTPGTLTHPNAIYAASRKGVTVPGTEKSLDPPAGQCRQCWLHAYDSRAQHRHLGPREDCPACVDHRLNGHGDQIVRPS